MRPYVPGEQPKIRGLIKLNTNENPYPPSPRVLASVRAAVDARLRLYPNPTAQPLREALARLHRCSPDQVFVGNGSDECLALAVRAFVEPRRPGRPAGSDARAIVQYFTPSYSLYPVIADAQGADRRPVPLLPDFGLPPLGGLRRDRVWRADAALTFVTTPNAPSGRGYPTAELDALCRRHRGVVMLDEAYVDFASEHALALALEHSHVLVARTFSKAYALCFQRVGYVVGHRELIAALDTLRDSYNVNGLGQVAALATLRDLAVLSHALPPHRPDARAALARARPTGLRGAAQPDELPARAPADVSSAPLARAAARAQGARPLVRRSGAARRAAHHRRHGSRGVGARPGSEADPALIPQARPAAPEAGSPHAAARSSRSWRSRTFWVSAAARANSARASSRRSSLSSRSPRTAGRNG